MMRRLSHSPWLTVALAALYPCVLVFGRNLENLLDPLPVLFSTAALVAGALLATEALRAVTRVIGRWWRPDSNATADGGRRLRLCAAAISLLAWMYLLRHHNRAMLAGICDLFAWGRFYFYGFCMLVSLAMLAVSTRPAFFRIVNPILLFLLAMSVWSVTADFDLAGHLGPAAAQATSDADRQAHGLLRLRYKPNVYFVSLESYHSAPAAQLIYGIDRTGFNAGLARRGFTIDNRAFSNYQNTLWSLSSTMLMDYHASRDRMFDARRVIANTVYNPVVTIFEQNGYAVKYLVTSTLVYAGDRYRDIRQQRRRLGSRLDDWLVPLKLFWYGQEEWLGRYVTIHMDTGDIKNLLKGYRASNQPHFVFIKMGADHTPEEWNYTRDDPAVFHATYRTLLDRADRKVLEVIDDIVSGDPQGCIILLGDHGTALTRDAEYDPLPRACFENIRDHGVSAELFAQDRFGILAAVRFPEPLTYTAETISPVNVFRRLFYALSGDETLLKTILPERSLYMGPRRNNPSNIQETVRDGVIHPQWVPAPLPLR